MELLFRIRKDQVDKNGRAVIYFQHVKNGVPHRLPTDEKVEVKYWLDKNGEWVKEKGANAHPLGLQINMLLSKKMQKAKGKRHYPRL